MIDLFNPIKPWQLPHREPTLIHSSEYGTMTPEEKKRREARTASNLKQYRKKKAA